VLAEPRPTMLNTLIKDHAVDEHRNLFCPQYARCLDTALRQGWDSWTCANCRLFTLRHDLIQEAAASRNESCRLASPRPRTAVEALLGG
jgi:hypothetical protein